MDGAIGEQAGETTAAGFEQALVALDVEERILLPGEAGGRQVLRGGGTAYREADLLAVLLLQGAVALQNFGGQVIGEAGAVDDFPGPLGLAGQRGDVVGVDVVEFGVQAVPGTRLVQHVSIGGGGDGEPVRHPDPVLGELPEHLTQRGVLATDQRHVLDPEVLEKADEPPWTHDLAFRYPFANANVPYVTPRGQGQRSSEWTPLGSVGWLRCADRPERVGVARYPEVGFQACPPVSTA